MRSEPELDVVDPLAAGREALGRGEWEQALAHFEAASERNHSAEAIEALAMAAWWLDNAQLAIESREHAYRLYRERGDAAAAARMAIWLGWDSLAFRGESAVARGWLQRAHRLLEGPDPVPEHGWLALREGEFAFLLENDIAATRRFAQRARSKNSRTTWLSTVNADGSPHVTAVGALWLDGAFWFQTGAGTRKGRNVARDPRCSIAVSIREADVVIEGEAARVTEPGALARIAKAWADNGWPAEPDDSGLGITAPFNAPSQGPPPWNVYRIEPRSAIVTLATEPGGLTRFRF